jgi:hypothetical protein
MCKCDLNGLPAPVILPAPAEWRLNCDGDLLPLVSLLVYSGRDEVSFDVLAIDGSRMRGDNFLVAGDIKVNLHGDLV